MTAEAPSGRKLARRIVSTPPMTGDENMRLDREALLAVEAGAPATLRFFRWSEPTLSYGRLQRWEGVRPLIPAGWPAVQRPTGGGIVFHQDDLCLSLCWPKGDPALPSSASEQYRWIHRVILEAMAAGSLRMASCGDLRTPSAPFERRPCFENPVGFDLLDGRQKVVGGALARRRGATLYQGSIQWPRASQWESSLRDAFAAKWPA